MITITPSGGAASLTYASGSGTSELVFTSSRVILSSETITIGYTRPGLFDAAGIKLASFTGAAVTNDSTQTGGGAWTTLLAEGSTNANDVTAQTVMVWDELTLPAGNVTKLGVYIRSFSGADTVNLGLYNSGGTLIASCALRCLEPGGLRAP